MPSKLDKIDVTILDYLQIDSRISDRQLSSKACTTIKTLAIRIKRLIDVGYIKGYAVELDLDKVGKKLCALTAIRLKSTSTENITMFREKMKLVPEVIECYHVNGSSDFILKIVVSDMAEYRNVLETRLSMSEIYRITTDFVLNEDKHAIDLSNLMKKWSRKPD